jgi:hypothetical protein
VRTQIRNETPIASAAALIDRWKESSRWAELALGSDPWGVWSASLRAKLVAVRQALARELEIGLSPLLEGRTELDSRIADWRRRLEALLPRIDRLLSRIPWCGVRALRPDLILEAQALLRAAKRTERRARHLLQLSANLDLGVGG